MLIILEGPDGAGKTTLAEQLRTVYDLGYHHEGPPPNGANPLWYYGGVLNSFRGNRMVMDRLALGERVYGPIYRNRDGVGEAGWRLFTRLVRAAGAVQVLCLPPPEAALKTWQHAKRDELYRQHGDEKFMATYTRYGFLGHTQDFIYDYTREGEFERLRDWLERTPTLANLPLGMVGHPNARYLLVGDQVGGVETGTHGIDLPFFTTKGSAAYLTETLDLAGFKEEELAFINSRKASGHRNLIPRFPRTFALGKEAQHACRTQGISHVSVPHPQFRKRFQHAEIAGYARMFKENR